MSVRPTIPIRLIQRFPFGRTLALRLYNRVLIHFAPRRRATTYFGAEFECNVNDLIGATIIHFGTWEPNSSKVFERIVRSGDFVVDLGANIGYFTLLFSKLAAPTGKVIAVEALPKVAAALAENVKRNGAGNVQVVNAAVASERGRIAIHEGPAKNIGASTTRSDRGFSQTHMVDCLPLDDVLCPEDAKRTSLIKIDIEGAEVPVVAQILDNLDSYSPRLSIAVEADCRQNPEWDDLFKRFLAAGYHAYDLANHYVWLNLINGMPIQPSPLSAMPTDHSVDILFTPLKL